ncbi:unnamed protein product [Prorocentrum cordatum]|uniref:Acetyl-coenzyme A transporter 1 n=1 Tax=Prorocentrum cordatum TaxID=2364126 RepID=A0ABN9Q3S3_9DINO|nr:unnamed protein product [Polarella glacialis]
MPDLTVPPHPKFGSSGSIAVVSALAAGHHGERGAAPAQRPRPRVRAGAGGIGRARPCGGRRRQAGRIAGGSSPCSESESSLEGEYGNIFLLLVLYTLQGIPMGLASVLPMVLKERGVSFSEIGTFSMNSYPFSLKILWAPVVDAAFIPSFGRRKTWMVPAQLLIGVVMLILSFKLDELLYVEKPWTLSLTGVFFLLHFLCATQDIAVDGWALTMLRRENVGYAATCNAIGQTLGYTLGFTGFMVLEHRKLLDLATFIFCCGLCFLVVTLAVAVLKAEAPVPPEDQPEDIPTAYGQMLDILKLRAIRSTAVLLFTWKVAFAIESLAPLKFQEYGVPKEHLAFVTSTIMPLRPAACGRGEADFERCAPGFGPAGLPPARGRRGPHHRPRVQHARGDGPRPVGLLRPHAAGHGAGGHLGASACLCRRWLSSPGSATRPWAART